MLTRRDLVLGVGASCLAASSARLSLGCQTNAWAIKPAEFDSLLAALRSIHSLGFQGFETGYRNLESHANEAAAARRQIESTGLEFFGVHIFLNQYDEKTSIAPADLYHKVAQTGAAMGAKRLILSGQPSSAGALSRKAAGLNRAGQYTKRLGMMCAYHNHGPEFADGGREIERLLKETDGGLVSFVVDAGHAFRAGADVPAFFRAHHRRIAGLHLRDFKDGKQVPLGMGSFPLKAVAQAVRASNWRGWVIAEEEREDGSKPAELAATPAIEAIRKEFVD